MVSPDATTDTLSSDVEWIPLARILTDHTVNTRPVDFSWVDARVATFDPDKLGVPIVSERPDGWFACLDGQNRIELCRRVGWGDQKILCKAFRNLTQAQEASLFLGHNDNRAVKPFHKFAARVTAGDQDAVAIVAIVQTAGWELSYFVGDKKIAAVVALETIYRAVPVDGTEPRGSVLAATLKIVTEAWGYSADAANGQILRGVGLVVARYGTLLDKAALVRKLAAHRGGALGLIADARGLHGYAGGTVSACVAESAVRIYNTNRRAGALPPWRQERGGD
jgi:hypothetical protein